MAIFESTSVENGYVIYKENKMLPHWEVTRLLNESLTTQDSMYIIELKSGTKIKTGIEDWEKFYSLVQEMALREDNEWAFIGEGEFLVYLSEVSAIYPASVIYKDE